VYQVRVLHNLPGFEPFVARATADCRLGQAALRDYGKSATVHNSEGRCIRYLCTLGRLERGPESTATPRPIGPALCPLPRRLCTQCQVAFRPWSFNESSLSSGQLYSPSAGTRSSVTPMRAAMRRAWGKFCKVRGQCAQLSPARDHQTACQALCTLMPENTPHPGPGEAS
jgi:hypothetical protein